MERNFHPEDVPANPLEKEGYALVFNDEFEGQSLDTQKWFPCYLPHWSSRALAAPNYRIEESNLILQITDDQTPWCPEFDGAVKCSSIQTGEYAGLVGSHYGQHRFNPGCTVREAQENMRIFVPQYGFIEMRAKGVKSRRNHVALWMIGYEDEPEKSGEIAIFEIMGSHINHSSSRVGYGVRRWGDPFLQNEFFEEYFPIDAARYHIYALEWRPAQLDFFIDNQKIKTIHQSPDYPMQFMLSIYELPTEEETDENRQVDTYPKDFNVDYFRAYQPIHGYGG